MTLIHKSTSLVEIIGFEVIAGIGLGLILNISKPNDSIVLKIVVVLVQADYLTEPHLVPHVTNVFNVSDDSDVADDSFGDSWAVSSQCLPPPTSSRTS
jgi:hypothetical protein